MVLFTLCFFLTTNKIFKKQNENENGKHGQRDMQRGKKARGGGGIGRKEPYAHSREGAWNGLQKEPATPRSETSNLQMVRQQTAVVLITQAVGFSAITALTNLESHIMEIMALHLSIFQHDINTCRSPRDAVLLLFFCFGHWS